MSPNQPRGPRIGLLFVGALALFLAQCAPASAGPITSYPAATTPLTGAETVIGNQGASTVQITASSIAAQPVATSQLTGTLPAARIGSTTVTGQSAASSLSGSESFLASQSGAPVKVTASQLATYAETALPEYIVGPGLYGFACNDVGGTGTDDTAAFNSLLTTVYNAGGGVIQITAGCKLSSGEIDFPNAGSGGTYPYSQPPIIVQGLGYNAGYGLITPNVPAKAFLDLQYTATHGKLSSVGSGSILIRDITLVDYGTDCAPFLFWNNTVIHVDRVLFQGTHSRFAACNQIAVLGGTGTIALGSFTGGFQGYGSSITNSYFDNMSEITFQSDANSLVVRDNTWDINSGNSTTTPIASATAQASSSFTGSISGSVLTVTAGTVTLGGVISGTGIASGTIPLSQTSGTTGGAGVYQLNLGQSSVIGSETITEAASTTLTVTAGHNFSAGQSVPLDITGATGSWTPINGNQASTVLSSTTFSIPVNSTSFGALTGSPAYYSGCAVDILGAAAGTANGSEIAGNLIESTYYACFAVQTANAYSNHYTGNSIWDQGAAFQASYLAFNTANGSEPTITDAQGPQCQYNQLGCGNTTQVLGVGAYKVHTANTVLNDGNWSTQGIFVAGLTVNENLASHTPINSTNYVEIMGGLGQSAPPLEVVDYTRTARDWVDTNFNHHANGFTAAAGYEFQSLGAGYFNWVGCAHLQASSVDVTDYGCSHSSAWTSIKPFYFPASGINLLGSSTGNTTFTSANAGASNYTITVPAVTDTLDTLTATQTLTNKTLAGPVFSTFVHFTPTTVSGLATADPSPSDGDKAYVTDATACTFNTAVTGSGSTHCPVHYDGSSSSWKGG